MARARRAAGGELTSWRALLGRYEAFRGDPEWLYRGQADAGWPLRTSLERAASRAGVAPRAIPGLERRLVAHFQRLAPNFPEAHPLPAVDDLLEWRALMQHHGSPTRLLDCTRSFFAAAFFALEEAEPGVPACIWAFHAGRLAADALSRLPRAGARRARGAGAGRTEALRGAVDRTPPVALLAPLAPVRLNRRLNLQHGAFLVPGDVRIGFEANLRAPGGAPRAVERLVVRLDHGALAEALRELRRMNMSAATLFPGLDGFARSLRHPAALPELELDL